MDRFKYLSLGAVTVLVLVLVVGLAAIAGAVATAAIIDEVDDDRLYYKDYDVSEVSKCRRRVCGSGGHQGAGGWRPPRRRRRRR